MAQVGGEACSGWAKASYEGECALGEGQAAREVSRRVQGRSAPIPEPAEGVTVVEYFSLDLYQDGALWRVPSAGGFPVYQLCLGD